VEIVSDGQMDAAICYLFICFCFALFEESVNYAVVVVVVQVPNGSGDFSNLREVRR
jgi:hypothetical protein